MSKSKLENKLVGISDQLLLPLVEIVSTEIWHFNILTSKLNQLRNIPIHNQKEINTDIDDLFSDGLFSISTRVEKLSNKQIKYEQNTKKDRKALLSACLLYTSPSPRDGLLSRMPSSA